MNALELDLDMATISRRQHEPHAHFPRPSLQGHALGLGLDDLHRRTVGKFQRAEMGGLDSGDSGQNVEQSRVVGVSVRMQGKSLHRATVSVPHGL